MIVPTPKWPVRDWGYVHMVRLHDPSLVRAAHAWCRAHFGGLHEGAWLDQGGYVVFVHETHAALFDMVWGGS